MPIQDLYDNHIAFRYTQQKYTSNPLSSHILYYDKELDDMIYKHVFKTNSNTTSRKRNDVRRTSKKKKKKKK